jgi:phage terminase large subunit
MLKVNKKVFEPLRKYDLVVHQGGSSSGKTYGILQYLFSVGAANPNEIITVVGQDIPNLKVGAYRDAQNILDDSEALRDWYPAELHNKSNRSFRCVNGSLVEFNSYSDEQDAKSGKRQRLFVNEANGVPYEVFEQLRMRTTKQVIIDFNPSAEFWAHKRLQEAHWVITSFRDNAFISPAVRERILSYEPTKENIERGTADKYRWDVYGLGKVGRLEGLVLPNWERGKFPDDYKWRIYGLDFGYTNDPTALVEIRLHRGNLHVKEHLYRSGLTNQDISREMERIGIDRNELIIADSAEPKSIEEINRMGWHIRGATKGKDSINQGIDILKRYKLIVEGENIAKELNSYIWAKDRNGNLLNKPIDSFNHCIDAMRYAITNRYKRLYTGENEFTSALI